ncbi:two-component system response regulator YesN [Paenibacillus amylolyticus]|uniref:Two-component system response regulator YesN n=1 Tax=Paenibacillus amylolyticus TaxID=1451 RepID=A0AAP5GZN8_PAEAM|nr:response regulator [Paenibacillus amylolyticus]MDR6723480.1 two-component system response regulator YesN [Paenibacillus amylolyticus]
MKESIESTTTTKNYRVLIADDEPIIREGIRDAIDWATLGMEVVGEAEDGEEALERAVDMDVDVVLVDMNMPFLNGIELIRALQQKCPRCRYLIISGHDEFAYAQEAVRLGVEDYILKPVEAEQLYSALGRLRQRLDEEHQRTAYVRQAAHQIERNIPLLRQRFCLEWLEGQIGGRDLKEQLTFLRLPSTPPVQIGTVRWPASEARKTVMRENDRQLFLYAVENVVSELLGDLPHVLFRDASGLIGICLWQEAPEEIASLLEQQISACLNIAIHAHVELHIGTLEETPGTYRLCRERVYGEVRLSPLVRRARQLIQEEYAERDLTLESLATRLQVSAVYLSRVLKKELDNSFVTLVTHARIRKAVQLLDSTTLPIHMIAERVGYDTQHYFSTAFKKAMGISPAQYRKDGGTGNRSSVTQ